MAGRKVRKVKLTALIIVGEGPHDKAFLNHMKDIYDSRTSGQKVTVNSADGGSPGDIIDTVIRKHRHTDFDKRYVLLDSDVPIDQRDRAKARKHMIELVESTPLCLEGMLLEILGQRAGVTNNACKMALHPQLAGKPTDPKAYGVLFPHPVLDATAKEQIVTLRHVIANTEPPK